MHQLSIDRSRPADDRQRATNKIARQIIVCRCSLSDSSLKQLRKTADELNERLAESFGIGVILGEPYICTVGILAWTIRVRVMWFNALSLSPGRALSRYEPSSGPWSGFTRNRFAEADYGGQRSSVKLLDDWYPRLQYFMTRSIPQLHTSLALSLSSSSALPSEARVCDYLCRTLPRGKYLNRKREIGALDLFGDDFRWLNWIDDRGV